MRPKRLSKCLSSVQTVHTNTYRPKRILGPRVPNTAAHKACGEFLAKKLEEFGAKVYNQYADLVAYDNTILKARNVIGAYNPESKRRVLLCAHWDSRPYADQDADKTKHHSPILGVNDGASGVGVLLEVAATTAAGSSHRHRHHLL